MKPVRYSLAATIAGCLFGFTIAGSAAGDEQDLVAKTGLLGILGVLGTINHFRGVPGAGRSLGLLRRIGSMELIVATTVLLLPRYRLGRKR